MSDVDLTHADILKIFGDLVTAYLKNGVEHNEERFAAGYRHGLLVALSTLKEILRDDEIIGYDEGGYYTDNGYILFEVALAKGHTAHEVAA